MSDDRISVRAVRGSVYSVGSSVVTLSLGFVRSVLMARLLLPEHFGVMALALFYTDLASMLFSLGQSRAIVHYKTDDHATVGTYLALSLLSVLLEVAVVLVLAPILRRFYPDMPLLAPILLVLAAMHAVKGLNTFQESLLTKDLNFRRLAVTDVASSVVMTIAAPLAAWQGWGVWSLVVEQSAGQLARWAVLWLSRTTVKPRLRWDPQTVRWFWSFGTKLWLGTWMAFLLDQFDEFWTGTLLGKTQLGFYSRAYEFARYPRRAVANPLVSVFFPTFATLQDDRLRLSKAFFRVTSLMIRLGFWFSLVFILAAPEFIRVVLGERWLPMLAAFQLMIVYTLGDPLIAVVSNMLMAVGHPELINHARVIQMAVFIPAVMVLAYVAGIVGVALSADLMVLVGCIVLFARTRRFVDYSARALWFYPVLALVLTTAAVLGLSSLWETLSSWASLFGKGILITGIYGLLLWVGERDQWREAGRLVQGMLRAGSGQ